MSHRPYVVSAASLDSPSRAVASPAAPAASRCCCSYVSHKARETPAGGAVGVPEAELEQLLKAMALYGLNVHTVGGGVGQHSTRRNQGFLYVD